MDYLEKTKDILSDHVGADKADMTLETRLIEDLGCDSLDCIELTINFEEEFNIEGLQEESEKLQTIGEIVEYLEKIFAAKN